MRAVNLIPADARTGGGSSIGRSGGAVYVVLGGLTVLVALMGLYVMAATGTKDKQTQLYDLQAQIQQASAGAAGDDVPGQVRQQRTQVTDTVRQVADGRMDWSTLLEDLGRTLPANTTLDQLDASLSGDATGTGATPAAASATGVAGPTVDLKGCAPSQNAVAELMPKLRSIPGVDGVRLVSSTVEGQDAAAGGSPSATPTCTGAAFDIALALTPKAAPAVAPAAATTPGAATAPTAQTPATAAPAPAAPATAAPVTPAAATPPTTGAGG